MTTPLLRLVGIGALMTVALAGCGGDTDGGTLPPPPPPPAPPPPPPGPVALTPIALDERVILDARPFGLAVTGTGAVLVSRLDNATVTRFQLGTAGLAHVADIAVGFTPTDVALNPAGTTAYVTNQHSSNVGVLNLATNEQTSTVDIVGSPFRVRQVGANLLAVTTNRGTVDFADAALGTVTEVVTTGAAPNAVVVNPAGTRIYVGDPWSRTITELDAATRAEVRVIQVGSAVQDLLISPDGTEIWYAIESVGVGVRRLDGTGTIVVIPLPPAGSFGLAMRPDGRAIVASSPQSGKLFYIDREARTLINTVESGGAPRRVAIMADGTVIVANESGWIDVLK